MALTRRQFVWLLPATGALACSRAGEVRSVASGTELARAGRTKADARTILVLMPDTRQTKEVWSGLADELGREFRLVAVRVDSSRDADSIERAIDRHRPAGLVLMNNPTVTAYRACQRRKPEGTFPPAVIVMTSFVEGQRIRGATGIAYEVPLITVVTNLRKLIATPIERVGVIHRAPLGHYVAHEASLASREQTVVVREQVGIDPNPSELKRAIRRVKERADAVWILNDDRLLTPGLIADGWLPGLNERPFLPAIVGAASLVSPAQSFGTFAVLPDHTALGVQAANLLFDIADSGWSVAEGEPAQLPLSTTTTIDLAQARERFLLRSDALSQVDRILDR